MPTVWRRNVQVPLSAPLPALTACCVIGDLPAELGEAYGEPACRAGGPGSHFALVARGGALVAGAPLANHVTWELQQVGGRAPEEWGQGRRRGCNEVGNG